MEVELTHILVVNVGSSSQKFCLFVKNDPHPIWKAHVDFHPHQQLITFSSNGQEKKEGTSWASSKECLEYVFKYVLETFSLNPKTLAIGHRIVHGGEKFTSTVVITDEVKQQLRGMQDLAPLHNLENLEGIDVASKIFPEAINYGVFDTAFHTSLSEEVYTYPLPHEWKCWGIRKFGFHGINHCYCSKAAVDFLKESYLNAKIVVCHLGSGSSICAIEGGKSRDTTMGMTPLEGLMMGTRSGSIDPGIFFFLLKEKHLPVETLEEDLYSHSGLLGISGYADIRKVIEAASKGDAQALLALKMFNYRLRYFIGAMIASLQGVDVIVFTGGIGEHCPDVRQQVCDHLQFLGVDIDSKKNENAVSEIKEISTPRSKVKILVIPAQEEFEIAQEGWKYL